MSKNTKELKKLMAKIRSIKFITSCIRVVNDAKVKMKKHINTKDAKTSWSLFSSN